MSLSFNSDQTEEEEEEEEEDLPMSALHRRIVLVGAGEQEASPSAISSRSSPALRKSNLAAVEAQVVSDRQERGKEDKKLAPDVKKKVECRPEDIDEHAEAFIRKFRQELQLQRLESLKNYEQMLARGL
ncbi:uncharacterized protein LOC122071978 [Macadamia integrifolia]|uniref:uncharacterized protein LOC122071978 n=1 Tax=Macadamia integrifolia TaxID=60698 RepID=UPI001C4F704A|nr:uncharacterized protein LOC122071978 [Macadamia integrifolia]